VLVALLAFASSATVILPEGTNVRPVQAGHIPLALLLGWPFAPVIAALVRGSAEFRTYSQARRDGQAAYAGPAVVDTAVAILAVAGSGWLSHTLGAPTFIVVLTVFAIEDLLALHSLALSGWQESWMEGGVSVRWRYAVRLMWLPAAASYPAVLAAGLLFTNAIAHGEWAIVALTGVVAQTLPLLLRQRSILLAEQAESAMNAVNTMEARDEYARGHTVRVTTVTIKILRELRVPFSDRIRAALIGPLHDIGKVTTSDRVLQKPGFHEPHERKEMKAHVADDLTPDKHWHWLLARRPELSWLVDLIAPGTRVAFERRLHHLEPSGNGYPAELQQHIRGTRIPIVARAMAVADVWDAMTSTRPYRAGMPAEKALQLLQDPNDRRQTYGGQLDRDCVDALVRLAKRGEVVPNDTSLLEFNRIRERLGERQPASAVSRLYAQALLASVTLTWLTAATGTSPWWSLLLIVQVGWALWANSATVRSSYELLRRLAIEAERRTGYDDAQATIRERSDLAAWLGRARGLPRKEVDRIRQAAELMNLGTLIVSDSDWRSSEPLVGDIENVIVPSSRPGFPAAFPFVVKTPVVAQRLGSPTASRHGSCVYESVPEIVSPAVTVYFTGWSAVGLTAPNR
jgi:response regulator RpfG family c-di-GMP phosphodiesterase